MRRLVLLVMLVAAVPAAAGDVILPGFAFSLAGKAGNRWTSDVFVTNPGAVEVQVTLADMLVVYRPNPRPCLPPSQRVRTVPPRTTIAWPAADVSQELGCVDQLVGALVFRADAPFLVASRMINDRGATPAPAMHPRGYGQEIPGIPASELAGPGATHMLAGLIWHPNACSGPELEVHVHFTNPADTAATVTLERRAGEEAALTVDGAAVVTPHTLALAPRSWRQVRVAPPPSMLPVCLDPELVDLFFTAAAPVAVYASVVDRTAQDPRTVLPFAVGE